MQYASLFSNEVAEAPLDSLKENCYQASIPWPSSQRIRRTLISLVLPLLLFAATVTFRAVGLKTFGAQWDEQTVRAVAINIWKGDLRNNWKYAQVPDRYRVDCYNYSSYLYLDALAAGPNGKYPVHRERMLSMVLGSLAVLLFYLVALHFFGQKTAVAAFAIMAIFPLLVQDAHYARPEAFVTFLSGVVFLLLIPLLSSARPLRYLAASSFCCGLLIACKISFIPFALIPFVGMLAAQKRFRFPSLGIWVAFTIAGTFAGVPDAFFHPDAFIRGVRMVTGQYAGDYPVHSVMGSEYCFPLLWRYFWQTLGPLCFLCAAGMLVLLVRRRMLYFGLLAVPVIFYIGVFSLERAFFERNLSHVAPLMAILCGLGIDWLTSGLPAQLRTAAFAVTLTAALIQPAVISYKLVFIGMRVPIKERAKTYEQALSEREQAPIVYPARELFVPGNVDEVAALAKDRPEDIIVPTHDYNDPYTRRVFQRLQRLTGAREVGHFSSLFPDFSPNTILAYHCPAIRYVRLPGPSFYSRDGFTFASWKQVSEVLRPSHVKALSWVRNGVYPDVKIPAKRDEFFGSYTNGGDANRGTFEMGPFETRPDTFLGIPFITGPVTTSLSVTVLDHATHRPLAQFKKPPVVSSYSIWAVELPSGASSQVDVLAEDDGASWGQWLSIGLPVRLLKPSGNS
jgi:hypothetical protein